MAKAKSLQERIQKSKSKNRTNNSKIRADDPKPKRRKHPKPKIEVAPLFSTFEEIYEAFKEVFSEATAILNAGGDPEQNVVLKYRFTLRDKRGAERVRVAMGTRDVLEIFGNSLVFKERKAYYAIKQDKRIAKLFEELEGENRLHGV